MKKKKIDLCLFFSLNSPNTNIVYFSSYIGKGIFVITKSNNFLIVPEYEKEKTKNLDTKIHYVEKTKFLLKELSNQIKNIKKTGIEDDKLNLKLFKKIKNKIKGRYCDISIICREIRSKKEKKELNYIKKACNVTDSIFQKICNNFIFKTEDEIREFIIKECKKYNCDLAFPPIAASGIGTSEVHYEGSKKLTKGFLMLDFGARYNGYCSDMTRMLYLGQPSKKELEKFNLVLNTLNICESKSKKIKKFSTLYSLAIKLLKEDSIYFTHKLGHGIGLDIHELPNLYFDSNQKIEENIPFTIEPGIYFENNFGIRIEDTVVIENGKLKILTKSKKKLVILNEKTKL